MVGLVLLACLPLGSTSCNSPHQPARRTDVSQDAGWPKGNNFFTQVSYQTVKADLPTIEGAEYVNDDELCVQCHEAYAKTFKDNVHRGGGCESCHGPSSKHLETRGKEPGLVFSFKTGNAAVRAEACLRCHEENGCAAGARWRVSKHAHCGVTCVDCHRGHYNVAPGTPATTEPGQTAATSPDPSFQLVSHWQPGGRPQAAGAQQPKDSTMGGTKPSLRGTSRNMGAIAPNICYRCHCDMQVYQQIAGPHQICGPNGFNCTTCHDPHGKLLEATRQDLCLQCHKGAPTMAWHSAVHRLNNVACTDCHNPHPRTNVPQVVNISHYDVQRPKRMQMAVQEPEACYKCHPKIFALTRLTSHHPIMEGKMVCSDCHDPHGQLERNLKAENINLLCYKCHAEKQGPFAYPHPPVTENCAICHEPHGTVTNNLLRQPATFLCLRCHVGHRRTAGHPAVPAANIDTIPNLRQPLYTNCTQCHAQIHGTDVPSPAEPNPAAMFR